MHTSKHIIFSLFGCVSFIAGSAAAAPIPAVVAAPIGATVQSVGGAVVGVGQGHAGLAPTVSAAAPAVEPLTDGVTTSLVTAGSGIRASGQNVQGGGLTLAPAAGAKTLVQTVRNGTLLQAKVGTAQIGKGAPTTVVGVGALTSSPPQGSLVTAGVVNANALLNANVAPQ